MNDDLLTVKNVSISFTQYLQGLEQYILKVISDLTLSVKEGEVVAILGSSGSGKSLLAHAILGILPENAICDGTIAYKGDVMSQEDKENLRGKHICLIPQSVNYLDPLMKVSEQAIGDVPKEEKEKALKHQREIFAKYGLGEEVDDMYPFELSGGMARKVLLSTALLSDPELIVADEPTPGLDEASVKETINDIKRLAEEGKGVLLITHEIDVALQTADRIAIFYSGYVIEINNVENFKNHEEKLLHPYSKALMEALPKNGFKLTEGVQPLEEIGGCVYHENCPLRTDKCLNVKPDLIEHNGAMVRCHKYSKGDE